MYCTSEDTWKKFIWVHWLLLEWTTTRWKVHKWFYVKLHKKLFGIAQHDFLLMCSKQPYLPRSGRKRPMKAKSRRPSSWYRQSPFYIHLILSITHRANVLDKSRKSTKSFISFHWKMTALFHSICAECASFKSWNLCIHSRSEWLARRPGVKFARSVCWGEAGWLVPLAGSIEQDRAWITSLAFTVTVRGLQTYFFLDNKPQWHWRYPIWNRRVHLMG